MKELNKSVLIIGGGPVGLSLAALLMKFGITVTVIEADESYCTGSRAICLSRRSLEIMGWMGADDKMQAKGLPWTGGRSYYRDEEVLHFQMPTDASQRFAPMVNIQQFYVEQFAHEALPDMDVRWNTKVLSVSQSKNGVQAILQAADGSKTELNADWLIACDGGKSTVRDSLGLKLQGVQYDGKYVIVDIEQDTKRPVERLAWFDPPSNPGSTILMHRQPDNIWRIDYQVRDDEDPAEAVKPENVLPRVQSHLDMIGETAAWKPLWISIYNAKCLTLPGYRQDRVFFAGDAAHLVPIFGVRGLNSGLDDAGNLAWKLAAVIQGKGDERLLDSYSTERVYATYENLKYGAKSTEFMAPPHAGFLLMREAALRLSTLDTSVRSLINPRQSSPVEYRGSKLNVGEGSGMPAPDAKLDAGCRLDAAYLSQLWGHQFVLLHFSETAAAFDFASEWLRVVTLKKADSSQAYERFNAKSGECILVRPDGYVAGRWASREALDLAKVWTDLGMLP
jgi:3-(3-hydroxy-phenyl)propionate hydroxylase